MNHYDFKSAQIPDGFFWLNEPKKYFFEQGLNLITKEKTDFWQTTHYGFKRDNGHCLLTKVRGDFTLKTQTEFYRYLWTEEIFAPVFVNDGVHIMRIMQTSPPE